MFICKIFVFCCYSFSYLNSFFIIQSVKKLILFVLLVTFFSALYASPFPSYDFTFYGTSDETLSSFTKENVGIDITGYGFIGTTSEMGIYLRFGIQTPVLTLIKIKDDMFSKKDDKTDGSVIKKDTNNSASTLTPTIEPKEENLTDNKRAIRPSTLSTNKKSESSIDSSVVDSSDSSLTDEPSIIESIDSIDTVSSEVTTIEAKTKSDITKTEWKLLFTIGPAYRKMMGPNAMVYLGLGASIQTQYLKEFSPNNGNYYSTTFAILGTDLDTGFRVSLLNSKTTVRIGVHFISEVLGVRKTSLFTSNKTEIDTSYDLYGYIAGKKGLIGSLYARGYIRLATTISEKTRDIYNYSNKTSTIGKGVIEHIISK